MTYYSEHREERLAYAATHGHANRRTHRRKIRARIAIIKLELGCADCGYHAHAEALEFDHLPGSKKLFGLAVAAGHYSWKDIEAEMAKCEVVCANCHRIRTASRRNVI